MTPELQKLLDDLRSGKMELKPILDQNVKYFGSLPQTFTYTGTGPLTIKKCEHPRLGSVPFDAKAARGLTSFEVRRRWPRLWLVCPDCNEGAVHYASFEHYIAGDW